METGLVEGPAFELTAPAFVRTEPSALATRGDCGGVEDPNDVISHSKHHLLTITKNTS